MTPSLRLAASELLAWRRDQLSRGGRSVDLDWLLDLGGGLAWSRLQRLLLDPAGTVVLERSLDDLAVLWTRHLAQHEPLQHLVGLCPWRDLVLESSASALIPRQETELLVDLALTCCQDTPPQRWADLGTGSGAIAVSLARAWPEAQGHAVDLSEMALELASRNLNALAPNHRCALHQGGWWDPLQPWWGDLDLVVSNPPYIPRAEVHRLAAVVRDHEPHLALTGGDDGLEAIRILVAGAAKALAPGGWLLLEHHYDQSDRVQLLCREAGLIRISAAMDLEGVQRFALACRPFVPPA